MSEYNLKLFNAMCEACSRDTTERYSTSFYSSIKLFSKPLRQDIFNIYGYVRLADEIVDTFHEHDKRSLLDDFRADTYKAVQNRISLNPILNSFQITINKFGIEMALVDAFLHSMDMDLQKNRYDTSGYNEYIYGSAEVVGLMCLHVFCKGDKRLYESLKPGARKLGAAFQKVNFLRDLNADFNELKRVYFPGCEFDKFNECQKKKIEDDIQADFDDAYQAILKLPLESRFGVYVAYKYYLSLFKKIRTVNSKRILRERIRIPDYSKLFILAKAGLRNSFNLM